jgi:hypothetical protein
MDFQTMNKQRIYLLIVSGIGVIAMFLPWIRISIMGIVAGSTNGMHDTGILVFLCFLGCGILAFLGDQAKPLDKTMWMITMLLSVIAAAIMVIWFFRMTDAMSFLSFGFYLALICSLALVFVAYNYRNAGYNLKDGFDDLKKQVGDKTSNTP